MVIIVAEQNTGCVVFESKRGDGSPAVVSMIAYEGDTELLGHYCDISQVVDINAIATNVGRRLSDDDVRQLQQVCVANLANAVVIDSWSEMFAEPPPINKGVGWYDYTLEQLTVMVELRRDDATDSFHFELTTDDGTVGKFVVQAFKGAVEPLLDLLCIDRIEDANPSISEVATVELEEVDLWDAVVIEPQAAEVTVVGADDEPQGGLTVEVTSARRFKVGGIDLALTVPDDFGDCPIVPIPPDGDCFFHCISKALALSYSGSELRKIFAKVLSGETASILNMTGADGWVDELVITEVTNMLDVCILIRGLVPDRLYSIGQGHIIALDYASNHFSLIDTGLCREPLRAVQSLIDNWVGLYNNDDVDQVDLDDEYVFIKDGKRLWEWAGERIMLADDLSLPPSDEELVLLLCTVFGLSRKEAHESILYYRSVMSVSSFFRLLHMLACNGMPDPKVMGTCFRIPRPWGVRLALSAGSGGLFAIDVLNNVHVDRTCIYTQVLKVGESQLAYPLTRSIAFDSFLPASANVLARINVLCKTNFQRVGDTSICGESVVLLAYKEDVNYGEIIYALFDITGGLCEQLADTVYVVKFIRLVEGDVSRANLYGRVDDIRTSPYIEMVLVKGEVVEIDTFNTVSVPVLSRLGAKLELKIGVDGDAVRTLCRTFIDGYRGYGHADGVEVADVFNLTAIKFGGKVRVIRYGLITKRLRQILKGALCGFIIYRGMLLLISRIERGSIFGVDVATATEKKYRNVSPIVYVMIDRPMAEDGLSVNSFKTYIPVNYTDRNNIIELSITRFQLTDGVGKTLVFDCGMFTSDREIARLYLAHFIYCLVKHNTRWGWLTPKQLMACVFEVVDIPQHLRFPDSDAGMLYYTATEEFASGLKMWDSYFVTSLLPLVLGSKGIRSKLDVEAYNGCSCIPVETLTSAMRDDDWSKIYTRVLAGSSSSSSSADEDGQCVSRLLRLVLRGPVPKQVGPIDPRELLVRRDMFGMVHQLYVSSIGRKFSYYPGHWVAGGGNPVSLAIRVVKGVVNQSFAEWWSRARLYPESTDALLITSDWVSREGCVPEYASVSMDYSIVDIGRGNGTLDDEFRKCRPWESILMGSFTTYTDGVNIYSYLPVGVRPGSVGYFDKVYCPVKTGVMAAYYIITLVEALSNTGRLFVYAAVAKQFLNRFTDLIVLQRSLEYVVFSRNSSLLQRVIRSKTVVSAGCLQPGEGRQSRAVRAWDPTSIHAYCEQYDTIYREPTCSDAEDQLSRYCAVGNDIGDGGVVFYSKHHPVVPDIRVPLTDICCPAVFLQDYYDSVLPGNRFVDSAALVREVNAGDLCLDVENARIVPNKLIPVRVRNRVSGADPKIHTAKYVRRLATPKELLAALVKRNWRVPMIAHPCGVQWMAVKAFNITARCFFRHDYLGYIDRYMSNPVWPSKDTLRDVLMQMEPIKRGRVAVADIVNVMRMALDQYTLDLKPESKVLTSLKSQYAYQGQQVLAAHPTEVTVIFSAVFRHIAMRLQEITASNVMVYIGHDIADLERMIIFSKNMRRSPMLTYQSVECDASAFDKSQQEASHFIKLHFYRMLGMPEALLRLWDYGHRAAICQARGCGVAFQMPFQHKSGDASTAIGNTIVNMASMAVVFEPRCFDYAAFLGDDNFLCGTNLVPTAEKCAEFGSVFNMEVKLVRSNHGYFCGNYIFYVDGRAYVIPDPLKRIESLGNKDSRTLHELHERFISLQEVCAPLNNEVILEELDKCMKDRLKTTSSAVNAIRALVTVSKSFKEYSRLYGALPN